MNSEKGRERIAGLYNNFKYYKLPEIEIFYGTSPNDFDEHTIDKFHPKNPCKAGGFVVNSPPARWRTNISPYGHGLRSNQNRR